MQKKAVLPIDIETALKMNFWSRMHCIIAYANTETMAHLIQK